MIGASHLLIDDNPRPDQLENLNLLRNSGEHLLALVNDILDFSKIEEGKLKIEKTFFDLKSQINNIYNTLKYQAEDKGISLEMIIPENLPKVVLGDPTRLNQILINLINNAIKFTDKGNVKLKLSLLEIERNQCVMLMEVIDTGIGIKAEKLKHIFNTFAQADEDTTRKYGGSGLGLSITKRLLELMGSQIRVESVPKVGSNFHFEMSFQIGEEQDLQPIICFGSSELDGNIQKKILLVEDHEVNKTLATKFLKKWGLEVDWAENGKVCLEKIASKSYDLILMDLQMPVMDGFKATEIIRSYEDSYFQEVPIVALTAAALLESLEKV